MIISKKKFKEKISEALEQAYRERCLHDKIDQVERECNKRIEDVHRALFDLEKQIAMILDKRGNDGT